MAGNRSSTSNMKLLAQQQSADCFTMACTVVLVTANLAAGISFPRITIWPSSTIQLLFAAPALLLAMLAWEPTWNPANSNLNPGTQLEGHSLKQKHYLTLRNIFAVAWRLYNHRFILSNPQTMQLGVLRAILQSVCFPLPLFLHLVVQGTVLGKLGPETCQCSPKLLENKNLRQALKLATNALGILPQSLSFGPGFELTSPTAQCTAFSVFFFAFIGFILPTMLLLKLAPPVLLLSSSSSQLDRLLISWLSLICTPSPRLLQHIDQDNESQVRESVERHIETALDNYLLSTTNAPEQASNIGVANGDEHEINNQQPSPLSRDSPTERVLPEGPSSPNVQTRTRTCTVCQSILRSVRSSGARVWVCAACGSVDEAMRDEGSETAAPPDVAMELKVLLWWAILAGLWCYSILQAIDVEA